MSSRDQSSTIVPLECGPETCESCGRSFSCGAKLSACWCAQVELTEDVRAALRGRFSKCLCRDCLERHAVPAERPRSDPDANLSGPA